MLVVFHVIVAKCGHEIGVVCLVCVQIELAASLPTFFHAVGHKVFKQCFLVCTECICKIRVKFQVILIIVDGLILGKLLGKHTYQWFLVINGIVGPLLLGGAVATFFTGSNFLVNKGNMGNELMPVISSWANGWHGLDALTNPWNLVLGFAVFFLARLLGNLYFINNIRDKDLIPRCRRQLITDAIPFLILFLAFVIRTLLADGFAVNPETKEVYMEPYKYFINLMDIPLLLVLFLSGVVGVLWGIGRAVFSKTATNGIWFTGIGVVLTVLALLLCAGYNNTAYYPSTADLQSSLTLANSCSSEFTLRTMAYVSILVPFVLAYIIYAWRAIDRKPITAKELEQDGHAY